MNTGMNREPSASGEDGMLARATDLIRKGNERRVVVRQGDRTVAALPLTFVVIGAVIAPPVAAIGVVIALINRCTISVEMRDGGDER